MPSVSLWIVASPLPIRPDYSSAFDSFPFDYLSCELPRIRHLIDPRLWVKLLPEGSDRGGQTAELGRISQLLVY